MATSKLPVLALPHPLILLPASRFTMALSKEQGEAVLALIEQSDALPVVAAVPITNSPSTTTPPTFAEWGTATRILRLVRPPARNPASHISSLYMIEYPPTERIPSRDVVEKFKHSALRLLDRLAKDAVQSSRKEGYQKIASMLDDITDARAPWMADVLIGSINGEYDDKLSILSTPDSETRLTLATDIFLKQASISEVSKKIASAVDESLSKQQKEFFLRQQLAAIQRELHSLTSNSPRNAGSNNASDAPSELDDDEQHDADDLADLKRKIEAMEHGSEERKMGVREWRRLKRIPQGSVENGVIRNYLEWLTSVPWGQAGIGASPLKDKAFLTNARTQLDKDHFGLEKIKRRLIEYLAVVRLRDMNAEEQLPQVAGLKQIEGTGDKALVPYQQSPPPMLAPNAPKQSVKGPILLFVGPPGVGKTSLGQSIAKALDRPFQRISLGGVRDEAEIRGHRRTYVASGPGLIVQAMRKAGRKDFVLLLDEIDKIGQSNFHGDPGAALLEVLDPEQNHTFMDHYLNVPVDLSQVLFICTSNSLDTISGPLLDRCEVIQLSGYTYDEKMHIARRFLLPKQITANGLKEEHVTITEPALLHIATRYTREAGVRSLERAIGAVVRFKAVEWAEYIDNEVEGGQAKMITDGKLITDGMDKTYSPVVEESDLEKMLGISRWEGEEKDREEVRGVVFGLVVMGQGEGGVMPVETMMVPGTGHLKLTGSLGDVIKESSELALSWVKRHAYDLGLTNARSVDPLKTENIDIHLHLPAGATKKDGPSAGVAMTCAFVSLLTGALVPSNIAMTGEITLRGHVTPVGGIKEKSVRWLTGYHKVLGAHRAHITKVILPWANRKDVEHDVAPEIRNEMEFVFVRTIREALDAAFGPATLAWRRGAVMVESRL
ncbi:ATP-dependent protease La [Hymenopellis radicata]|nr:ATP-dependent protease La [Hymenopellis radicata]